MYAIAPDMQTFQTYTARNVHFVLVFIVNNNHCFPIVNEDIKQYVSKAKVINLTLFNWTCKATQCIFVKQYKDEIELIDNVTYGKDTEIKTTNEYIQEIIELKEKETEMATFNEDGQIESIFNEKKNKKLGFDDDRLTPEYLKLINGEPLDG